MHLINADALEREGWYLNRIIQTDKNTMEYQTKKPTEFPAIEPERKTGKWMPQDLNKSDGLVATLMYYYPRCSVCGHSGEFTDNYCSYCGADMRGGYA